MNGVVLWHDRRRGSAIIWCEDHADLAYFTAETEDDAKGSVVQDLAAGDLVIFDIKMVDQQRRACCMRRLAPGTSLAEHVLQAAMAVEAGELGRALRAALHLPEEETAKATSAEVIDWSLATQARKVG